MKKYIKILIILFKYWKLLFKMHKPPVDYWVTELVPPHAQSAWGSRGERVRAAGFAACCNYFSKKKKKKTIVLMTPVKPWMSPWETFDSVIWVIRLNLFELYSNKSALKKNAEIKSKKQFAL